MDRRTFVSAAAIPLVAAVPVVAMAEKPPHFRLNYQRGWFKEGQSSITAWANVLRLVEDRRADANEMEWRFNAPQYVADFDGVYGSIVASHEPGLYVPQGRRLSDIHRDVCAYEAARAAALDLTLWPHDVRRANETVTRAWRLAAA